MTDIKIDTKTDTLKNKSKNNVFTTIVWLFIFSFFDESEISLLTKLALLSTFLIPVVLLWYFIFIDNRLNKSDNQIIMVFLFFIIVQIIGIRLDDIYRSLTPIYRTLTTMMIVLYFRKLTLDKYKIRMILYFSVIVIILGFATIFTPARENTNILFGNYNTVGVLYFTLFAVHFIIYLYTKKISFIALSFADIILVILSNTRTALILIFLSIAILVFLKMFSGKTVKPSTFYPFFLIAMIAIILFYFNIKTYSFYNTLNQISKSLFDKNFDSGRPDLWHYTVDIVGDRIWLGCGTGVNLEMFMQHFKTSHSVYFDLYLQNGIIGLLLYAICIITTLRNKGKWNKNNASLFIMIIAFAFLLYNSMGIVFTKARSGIGLLQWGLMALPYTPSTKYKLQNKSYNKENFGCKNLGVKQSTSVGNIKVENNNFNS